MSFISGFTELFKGKKQEVPQQNAQAVPEMTDQQHQEAVRAWNSVDPHPADARLMNNNTTAIDSREIANKRAELAQISQESPQPAAEPTPILKPAEQTPSVTSFEKPMAQAPQAPVPEEKAA